MPSAKHLGACPTWLFLWCECDTPSWGMWTRRVKARLEHTLWDTISNTSGHHTLFFSSWRFLWMVGQEKTGKLVALHVRNLKPMLRPLSCLHHAGFVSARTCPLTSELSQCWCCCFPNSEVVGVCHCVTQESVIRLGMAFWLQGLQVETVRLTFFFCPELMGLGLVLKAAFWFQKHLTVLLNY